MLLNNNIRRVYENPVVAAIQGFDRPDDLWAIVPEEFESIFNLKKLFYLNIDDIKQISFFGYLDQCKTANNFRHKGKIVKLDISMVYE